MKFSLKSNGFTLVEVLIAIIILSVSLLALAALMSTTAQNTSFGGHITEAATFAQDQLERLRVTTWGDASLNDGAHINNVAPGLSGIGYDRTWTVVTNGNVKTVTITINWTDQTAHTLSLISAISNPNP